jgi:hypothetical protein
MNGAPGGLLERGLGVAAAKDVPGGEQEHADDRAGNLDVVAALRASPARWKSSRMTTGRIIDRV